MRGSSIASNALYMVVLSAIAMASERMATVVKPRWRARVLSAIRSVERSIIQLLLTRHVDLDPDHVVRDACATNFCCRRRRTKYIAAPMTTMRIIGSRE